MTPHAEAAMDTDASPPLEDACPPSDAIKIASYNIHLGIGADGQFSPPRVAQVLQELNASIIAVQEIESGANGFDMLAYLRDASGLQIIHGPTLHRVGGGAYGNALLTRHPVRDVRRIDLSYPRREPRGALDVELDCDGERLRVVSTHLGLRPAERRAQVRQLLALLEKDREAPAVLMGDLNEWFLLGRPLRWLHAHFDETPALRTFPARRPLLALDRIWVRPHSLLRHIGVHVTPLARIASDHLPLTATLNPLRMRSPR